jgi:dTDP-4-dehydrorhamnose 3,5-epimerase-like enzyme
MINDARITDEIVGLYRIIPLNSFRRTRGVFFENVPTGAFRRIDAIDRVVHVSNAISPGPVGAVKRPWYMHTHQDDNLIVLHGTRYIELYTRKYGKVENFLISAEWIKKDDMVIFDGPAMLCWPKAVFHRVLSAEEGSVAINFAVHHEGIDMRTNFNIYDVDVEAGTFSVIREAYLDQVVNE